MTGSPRVLFPFGTVNKLVTIDAGRKLLKLKDGGTLYVIIPWEHWPAKLNVSSVGLTLRHRRLLAVYFRTQPLWW